MQSSPAELLSKQPEADAEAVLAWHNAGAAIETLLKDCRYLRRHAVR